MIRSLLRAALPLGLLILTAVSLYEAQYRVPWSDEGWFASPAYNLAYNGFMGTTILETAGRGLPNIEERTYWVLPLYLVNEAAWYRVFGHSLPASRMLSLLWAILATLALYVFGARLTGDKTTAGLAALFFSVEFTILDVAAFARPEVMCLALGLLGLASYLYLREVSLSRALLVANGFLCLSGLTHPNGILHFAVLAFCVLYLDRQRLSVSAIALSAIPYLVFGGIWLLYVTQDWNSFVAQLGGNSDGRSQLSWNPLVIIWRELNERYFFAYGLRSPSMSAKLKMVVLLSYALAFGGLLASKTLRRTQPVVIVLAAAGIVFAIQSVFNQKLSYYIVHIVPWFCLALAIWINHLRRSLNVLLRWGTFAWIAVLCLLQLAGMVMRTYTRTGEWRAMTEAVRFVNERAPNAELIIGSASLIYDFDFDPRLLDDNYLGVRSGKRADVIILDENYRLNISDWHGSRPEDAAKIDGVLATYEMVHDAGGYQVYFNR